VLFGLDWTELVIRVPAVLLALTLHEFAHAWSAYRLGDPTAHDLGRCSLNPLQHLDPLGTLCIMFAPIGWAKPVPVNPLNFRRPGRDDLLVSAAGPLSNAAQALTFAVLLRILGWFPEQLGELASPLYNFLFVAVLVNVGLAVFNMLPLFPLDGFHVTLHLLPRQSQMRFAETRQYGMLIILGLVALPWLTHDRLDPLGIIIWRPVRFLLEYVAGLSLGPVGGGGP
jgi:Zn-dependent protease